MNKLIYSAYILVLDLLFPIKCLICGRYGEWICSECIKGICLIQTDTCFSCGKISKHSQFCSRCSKQQALKGIVGSVSYESTAVKELVHNLKYGSIHRISELLGEYLVQRVIRSDMKFDDYVVVPVPSSKKRQNQRGYNQAELIARYLCKRLNLRGALALEKIAETKPQVSFGREQRIKNIVGSIICCDEEFVLGKKVLLIDDISTTGATLGECAKILKIAGASEVWGLVVAHA